MYKRGAIVIQEQPSVLHHLLGGLGAGITQGAEKQMRKAEERRARSATIMGSVLSGDMDSRLLATEEGQGWLKKQGIYDDPEIQNTVLQGQLKAGLLGVEGMGPPAPYKLSTAQDTIREEAQRLATRTRVQEIEDSLFVYQAKLEIKKEIEKPRTLNQRIETAVEGYNKALKMGIPVEDIKVKDPDSGVEIDLLMHIESLKTKQAETIAKSKEGLKYLTNLKTFYDMQIGISKYFHNLVLGKIDTDSELTGDFRTLLDEIRTSLGMKELSAQDIKVQVRRLLPLFNKKLKIQHEILMKQRKLAADPSIRLPFLKQFSIKEVLDETGRFATEFEVIERFSNSIGNVTQGIMEQQEREAPEKTPTEPVKVSQSRALVMSPPVPAKPQPTPEEIETKAKAILMAATAAGMLGPNGETMTIEVARRLAREALGVKEKSGAKK